MESKNDTLTPAAALREIKIQKGIPMPAAIAGRSATSIFRLMEVGDSVFFAGMDSRKTGGYYFRISKSTGRKFCVRNVEENGVKGVRIWRTV